ncbi:MAG: hypothetical protein HYX99_00825 [Chloroflexi bacterium]|nr:hypothetical protein [Chloroflexota bacterium]
MESQNKALAVGLSGLSALVWLVALVVALFFFPAAADFIRDMASFLAQNSGLYMRLMFAAVFAVLLLVSVLLILVAYTPPSARAVPLPRVPGGVALLTPEAIGQYLRLALTGLPDVVQARPSVRPRGRLLDVSLELSVPLGIDLTSNTAQVQEKVQQALSRELGLGLGRLQVFYQWAVAAPGGGELADS